MHSTFLEKVRWRFIRWLLKERSSQRTLQCLEFQHLCGSRKQLPMIQHSQSQGLHLGCGKRILSNWLNLDAVGGDFEVDFRRQMLPFADGTLPFVVSQHVIEHLNLDEELPHLFCEIYRVLKPGGEFWVSTPDLQLVCEHYVSGRSQAMLDDMRSRHPEFSVGDLPSSQIVNWLFHQDGQHINLLDFDLLKHALEQARFMNVQRTTEESLLNRFPDFPARNDSFITLYAVATK